MSKIPKINPKEVFYSTITKKQFEEYVDNFNFTPHSVMGIVDGYNKVLDEEYIEKDEGIIPLLKWLPFAAIVFGN